MTILNTIKARFKTCNIAEKLIAINLLVFALVFLLRTLSFLLQKPIVSITHWFSLPNTLSTLITQPWSIITYAFFHASIWHILSNMLILYYASHYFLSYFSAKRLLNYYVLGAICGALVFVVSYNIFPAFVGQDNSTLIGASAAVMAILVGIATHIPNMGVRLVFFGSIKLWWIAAALIAIDIIQIPVSNPGGHLAHLGGALLGYIYTKQLSKGRDIGSGFEKFMDWFFSLFSTKRTSNKSPLRTVYKTQKKSGNTSKSSPTKTAQQQKVDAILDKISKSGYDSLSKEEKDVLFNAGKDH